jgi:hypothetical protein
MTNCNLVPRPFLKNAKFGKDKHGEDVDSALYRQIINELIYFINNCHDLTCMQWGYLANEHAQIDTFEKGPSYYEVS